MEFGEGKYCVIFPRFSGPEGEQFEIRLYLDCDNKKNEWDSVNSDDYGLVLIKGNEIEQDYDPETFSFAISNINLEICDEYAKLADCIFGVYCYAEKTKLEIYRIINESSALYYTGMIDMSSLPWSQKDENIKMSFKPASNKINEMDCFSGESINQSPFIISGELGTGIDDYTNMYVILFQLFRVVNPNIQAIGIPNTIYASTDNNGDIFTKRANEIYVQNKRLFYGEAFGEHPYRHINNYGEMIKRLALTCMFSVAFTSDLQIYIGSLEQIHTSDAIDVNNVVLGNFNKEFYRYEPVNIHITFTDSDYIDIGTATTNSARKISLDMYNKNVFHLKKNNRIYPLEAVGIKNENESTYRVPLMPFKDFYNYIFTNYYLIPDASRKDKFTDLFLPFSIHQRLLYRGRIYLPSKVNYDLTTGVSQVEAVLSS